MKYLVVCQDNIGDLVFTSSIVSELYKHDAAAEIYMFTRSDTHSVAEFMPYIKGVFSTIALTKLNPMTSFSKFKSYFEALKWIKLHQFDVAITVSKNWRLGLLLKNAKIPIRSGFAFPKLKPMLTHVTPLPSLFMPVVESLMVLLSNTIGSKLSTKNYELDIKKINQAKQNVLHSAIQTKSDDVWFGLHPFASQRNRCVSLDVWLELSQFLSKNRIIPIWFGSPLDLNFLRETTKKHSQPYSIGYTSDELCSGNLDQTIPLLSLCDGYIGHDSGVLHLASSIGVKTLGIFTPGEPKRTFAQGVGETHTFYHKFPKNVQLSDMLKEAQTYFSEYL